MRNSSEWLGKTYRLSPQGPCLRVVIVDEQRLKLSTLKTNRSGRIVGDLSVPLLEMTWREWKKQRLISC